MLETLQLCSVAARKSQIPKLSVAADSFKISFSRQTFYQFYFILALFMFRNSLENLPDHFKADYMDTNPNCVEKVKVLKNAIKSKFPVSAFRFLPLWETFNCSYYIHALL